MAEQLSKDPTVWADIRADVAARHRAGEPVADIAAAYGKDPIWASSLLRKMRRAGEDIPTRRPLGNRRIEVDVEALQRLWLQGATYADLAEAFGIRQATVGTVVSRLRREGVALPRRSTRRRRLSADAERALADLRTHGAARAKALADAERARAEIARIAVVALDAGARQSDVAVASGISVPTLHKLLREAQDSLPD